MKAALGLGRSFQLFSVTPEVCDSCQSHAQVPRCRKGGEIRAPAPQRAEKGHHLIPYALLSVLPMLNSMSHLAVRKADTFNPHLG